MPPRLWPALLLALLAGMAQAQPAPFAAYHESWSEVRVGDPAETRLARLPTTLDIVMLAFARPDARYSGNLDLRDTGLGLPFDGAFAAQAVAALRRRQPGVRVLLSVGGATYTQWEALDATALARLVADLGLDGVDVDFEPGQPACMADLRGRIRCASDARFIASVTALRRALPRPLLLAVAGWSVGAFGEGEWHQAQPRGRYTGMALALLRSPVAREIDMINIMAYDAGPLLDPLEAMRAYRHHFAGLLLVGIVVQDRPALPVAARLQAVQRLSSAVAAEQASGPTGMMLYSLQMTSPNDRPGNAMASRLAATVCRGLGRIGCDVPLP